MLVEVATHLLSKATTALIKVGAVLVTHLTASLATTELAPVLKTSVPVSSYDTIIQTSSIDVTHGVAGVISIVEFYEAKAAWCLVMRIKAHDDALDIATLSEKFENLLFRREERHVANIESYRLHEKLFLFSSCALELGITIGAQLNVLLTSLFKQLAHGAKKSGALITAIKERQSQLYKLIGKN